MLEAVSHDDIGVEAAHSYVVKVVAPVALNDIVATEAGVLPELHRLPVREVRWCAGPGFVIIVCGDIMTMPGLPRSPAVLEIGLNDLGEITGLF